MRVIVMFPDDKRGEIEAAAKADGLPVSTWVRFTVMKHLNDEKPSASNKPITDAQKKRDQYAEWDARFGKGKVTPDGYLGTEAFNVWWDVRKKIKKPDSDAVPFKGHETDDDLRRVISYWVEHGGEYAHAKRLYGEALMKLPVDKREKLALFDALWDEENNS